jgi:hypothetical protein
MDPMKDAIRQKRMGGAQPSKGLMDESQDNYSEGGGTDLQSIVEGLSDQEKGQLMQLLQDSQADKSSQIQNGAPSSDEEAAINGQIQSQEGQGDVDSDELARSMLQRSDMNGTAPEPRNLGERMRASLASKLKGKGKI